MKKSTLLMIVSVVLALTLSLGGTLAYLQDSDSDVNVMTLGSVYIEQIEQEWNADHSDIVNFKDDKPLYPIVGEINAYDKNAAAGDAYRWMTGANNIVDKYVSVKNTGKSPAYVRTIIALEMGSIPYEKLGNVISASVNLVDGKEYQFAGAWKLVEDSVANVEGLNYNIMIFEHQDAVEPGETTIPSLLQVYMKSSAGNEEVEAIDGNKNGKYDIIAVSQAVQTAGFETAAEALEAGFPMRDDNDKVDTAKVAAWLKGLSAEEDAALSAGAALLNGGTITLSDDVYLTSGATEITKDTVYNLNGQTISSNHDNTAGADKYSTLTVYSNVTMNGPGAVENENGYAISVRHEDAVLTINGGNYTGATTAINVVKGTLIINGGYFEDVNAEDNGHYLINCIDANYNKTAKVAIKGGTFKNWNPAANTSEGAGTNFVAAGYKSVLTGENEWTVVPDADVVEKVENTSGLANALENAVGGSSVNDTATLVLGDGNYTTNMKIPGGKEVSIIGNGDTQISGQIATTTSDAGTLYLKDLTINVSDAIQDSTGISQTGKSAIAIWGNQTVICENVTFNMDLGNSTAITSWWDTNEGTTIIVRNCTFNCNGQRPIRATGNVTVENCTFNDPYRYAVQLTAKASTATELDKAIINFNNNTIVNGENGKDYVYGIQLEGADYGCSDLVINGAGNEIVNGGDESTMYYCECGKVQHNTIEWNTEATPKHAAQ